MSKEAYLDKSVLKHYDGWFIRVQFISILSQPVGMVLTRHQNQVNNWSRGPLVNSSIHRGLSFGSVKSVGEDHSGGYDSHQDSYSVTICVELCFA